MVTCDTIWQSCLIQSCLTSLIRTTYADVSIIFVFDDFPFLFFFGGGGGGGRGGEGDEGGHDHILDHINWNIEYIYIPVSDPQHHVILAMA